MTDTLPVNDPRFWKKRIEENQGGEPWLPMFHTSKAEWEELQAYHTKTLAYVFSRLRPKSILDAGCGPGFLVECIPSNYRGSYLGIDISPEFIELARNHYPARQFNVQDLVELPYNDLQFDIVLCRSVKGMITGNLGGKIWEQMEFELGRVARYLVLLSLGVLEDLSIIKSDLARQADGEVD